MGGAVGSVAGQGVRGRVQPAAISARRVNAGAASALSGSAATGSPLPAGGGKTGGDDA